MKKLILCLFVYCISQNVVAGDYAFGIDVLKSFSDVACDDVKREVINPLWKSSCEDSSFGYSLSVSVKASPTFHLALAYIDFGEVQWKSHFTGFPSDETQTFINRITVKFGASALEFSGRKDFLMSNERYFNLYAGLSLSKGTYDSVQYREDTERPNSGWYERNSESDENISPMWGFGITYKNLALAYKLHKNIGSGKVSKSDISSVYLGLRF